MQNIVPDAMRLNQFVHVELPDNSRLFLRTENMSIPHGPSDVQTADFTSRKTEKLVQQEQAFLQQYQSEMNRLDKEEEARMQQLREQMQNLSEPES